MVVLGQTDTTLSGDVVDTFGITGHSAYAETFIVDLIPVTLATNSVDRVISSNAAALSVGEDLINSTTNHAEATLVAVSIRTHTFSRLDTECSVSGTLCALAIDEEEGLNAGTCVVVLVVDLVGETRNPANL